jgi:hypothetical protein
MGYATFGSADTAALRSVGKNIRDAFRDEALFACTLKPCSEMSL